MRSDILMRSAGGEVFRRQPPEIDEECWALIILNFFFEIPQLERKMSVRIQDHWDTISQKPAERSRGLVLI